MLTIVYAIQYLKQHLINDIIIYIIIKLQLNNFSQFNNFSQLNNFSQNNIPSFNTSSIILSDFNGTYIPLELANITLLFNYIKEGEFINVITHNNINPTFSMKYNVNSAMFLLLDKNIADPAKSPQITLSIHCNTRRIHDIIFKLYHEYISKTIQRPDNGALKDSSVIPIQNKKGKKRGREESYINNNTCYTRNSSRPRNERAAPCRPLRN